MRNRQSGVTLVELMTVVVIVAMLAAFASPSYRAYLIRAHRSDAKTALMFTAGALERCYTRNNSYDPAGAGCTVSLPSTSENGYYQVTANIPGPPYNTFTLTATPQAAQAGDAACGNFTLDNLNTRGISGTRTVADCWGK